MASSSKGAWTSQISSGESNILILRPGVDTFRHNRYIHITKW